MLPNDNLDTKNLNLTPYLFGPKKGEYYRVILLSLLINNVFLFVE